MAETMRERIAGAIMRAYFSRPIDEQKINVTVADQLDLADAVLDEIRKPTAKMALAAANVAQTT